MSEEVILCITEGVHLKNKKINEVSFIEKYLSPRYLDNKNIEIISYGTNIYELFRELEADPFLDTYSLLQEYIIDESDNSLIYGRDDIAEIYLFFDLDAHATQKDCISKDIDAINEMIKRLSNQTEEGKLYVSYPMFEAYKHPVQQFPVTNIFENNYKKYVASICDKNLEQLAKLDNEQWHQLLKEHFLNINEFLYQDNFLPNQYKADDFSQHIIYECQLKKHIIPDKQVRVISPFPLFLLDCVGNSLLEQWK